MRRASACAMLVWAAVAISAHAHFMFVRITPPAEGGRGAEVYFSELAAAGDPRYIDRLSGGKFEVQTTPGEFRELPMRKLADRLRGHVPVTGSLMVVGQLDYGVLNRPLQPTFLLRHYSQAVAGQPAEVNKLATRGARLEVAAQFAADEIALTALLAGKPLPDATFSIVDTNLSEEELKADAAGRAVFKPAAPGVYSIYIKHVDPTPGEYEGKSYKEIREFATLAFAWPLAPQGADEEAVKLFEDALSARAVWNDFTGFTAKISGIVDDRPFEGIASVAADGSVQLKLSEDVVNDWAQHQLESITMHRAASQKPSAERPRPVLRFADDHEDHPLGRLLTFDGGNFASSYRVKDRQITSVNRVIDGKNMTITMLANAKTAEGQFLPASYTVQYWDDATGKLERTESVHDEWKRVGAWDLPTSHTVSTSSENGFTVRSLKLSDHQPLK